MNTQFSREQKFLLWLACSAIFFEAFDVSIVNLALPLIAADLHLPLATGQWMQTIYLLTCHGLSGLYGLVAFGGPTGTAGGGGGYPKHALYGRFRVGVVLH
ncbi:MAG TPA: hypothetical protein VGS79_16610 [Puia sp.]|nr:hypothetical protein [Puia sp.]